MNSNKITGAEALMRSLENEGVDILFGYPGGAIMPTYVSSTPLRWGSMCS